MTSRYITTSGEFNQLIPTYSNGDDVYIQDGAVATMAHSPNFRINTIQIQEGDLIIDGANGTSPIHLAMSSSTPILLYSGQSMSSTDGKYIIGTADGSPSQVIDLTNYFTGGGGNSDIYSELRGIWGEWGKTYYFTEGTGTLPERGNWIYKKDDQNQNYGYVWEAGTSSGTGYITTKYTIGTIAENDEFCFIGIADRNGPSLERIWCGTVSGQPEIARDIWTPMFNVRSGGTDGWFRYTADTPTGLSFLMAGGTSLTLGDGVHGSILENGARLAAPGVLISYAPSSEYTSGTTSNPFASDLGMFSSSYAFGNVDLRGVNFCGYDPASSGLNSMEFRNCMFNASLILTGVYFNDFLFDGCVFQKSDLNGYKCLSITTGITGGTITNSILAPNRHDSSGPSLLFENLYLPEDSPLYVTDNMIMAPYVNTFTRSSYINFCQNMTFDNNIMIGINAILSSNDMTFTNNKFMTTTSGGTDTGGYDILTGNILGGDLTIKGVEFIHDYVPGGSFISDSAARCDNVIIRNIGSPHRPIRLSSLTDELIDIGGKSHTYLDVARVFVDPDVGTFSKDLYAGNVVDIQSFWRDIILGDSSRLIPRGYNNSVRGVSIEPDQPTLAAPSGTLLQMRSGSHWHDYYRNDGYGQIQLNLTQESSLNNPYNYISGEPLRDTIQEMRMAAGDIVEITMDYFAKGHTGFTGTIAQCDTATGWGNEDWNGTVRTYFQWDTGGTGFNGTWTTTADSVTWQGLDLQTGTGVKLKYRFEADTDTDLMYGFATQTTTSREAQYDWHNWTPIDQVEADITLENVVVGSRYWIYNNTTGSLITSGVAASSTVSHTEQNLNNGTQLKLRVRYASDTTKYLPFETLAIVSNLVANIYVSQIEDSIAT